MKNYLGVDVGGTSIKYALVNEAGELSKHGKLSTPDTLLAFYQAIEDIYQFYTMDKIEGLALSMPGAVDSERGIIGGASALDYIHGPNIKKDLEKRLSLNVEIENDANCAALAETWIGNAKDTQDSMFIISGTGIGGALIKDKKIHKGVHLHGGEYGYMIREFDLETQTFKTWSDVASTVALVRHVAQIKGVPVSSLSGEEIFLNVENDPIYKKAVDRFYFRTCK